MHENDRQLISAYGKFGYGLFIALTLAVGCAQTEKGSPSQLEWSGQPTMHQVRSATLREKMRSLKVLMFDNIYDELQFDEERARQAGDIAEIANAIAVAAMDISSISQELNLGAKRAQVFHSYAQDLKNQAIALQEATHQEKSDAYPSMIRAIVQTCNRCHNKFR